MTSVKLLWRLWIVSFTVVERDFWRNFPFFRNLSPILPLRKSFSNKICMGILFEKIICIKIMGSRKVKKVLVLSNVHCTKKTFKPPKMAVTGCWSLKPPPKHCKHCSMDWLGSQLGWEAPPLVLKDIRVSGFYSLANWGS